MGYILKNTRFIFWSSLILLFANPVFGQTDTLTGVALIDKYLLEEKLKQADSILNEQLTFYNSQNLIDSLYAYPYYVGKIAQLKTNTNEGIQKATNFVNRIVASTTNKTTLYKSYKNISDFYDALGLNNEAYNASKTALNYALQIKNIKPEEIALMRSNMGYSAYSLNNFSESKQLYLQATKEYESSKTTKSEALADAYNTTATLMWHFNKLDSAQIYFEKAIKTIDKGASDKYNKLYLISVTKTNIALLEESKGNVSTSISIQKDIIKTLDNVIKNTNDQTTKERSKRIQSVALSNLGATYSDLGNLTQAYEIEKLAYKKKKEAYEPTDIRIANTLLNIAIAELNLKEYDKSINTCNKIIEEIDKSPGDYLVLKANVINIKAQNYLKKGNVNTARDTFLACEKHFANEKPTEYTQEHLDFLITYSQFLANQNSVEESILKAKKGYNYVYKYGGSANLSILKQIINVGQVYYTLGNYNEAEKWATDGISYINNHITNVNTTLDSLQLEFKKPPVTLLKLKAAYKNESVLSTLKLEQIAAKLNKLTQILEKQKSTVFNNNDVNSIILEYNQVIDFSKKIQLQLYELTSDEEYLRTLLSLQESGLYYKIRSRLNLRHNFDFNNVPKEVTAKEKTLKNKLENSLTDIDNLNVFFEASETWATFLDSLKTTFPKYYKMRYATIGGTLEDIQNKILKGTTVVRYFFIEDVLYAYVVSEEIEKLFPLDYSEVTSNIALLGENQSDINETSTILNTLYQKLWQPFEAEVKTKNVVIVPDGILYNLSFETLTAATLNSFKELADKSLLTKHNISYNYSLYLIDSNTKSKIYDNSYIAFAPEFNDKMKENYKIALTDSLSLDKAYLKLLQQPFNVSLAKTYGDFFDGNYFVNENSTEQIFKTNANEHKIIHIGTHAESNNISPELSRLIFAKDVSNTTAEDGSLYTYEIYNTSLNSNLAILTACETGKPSYQAGEGMISLAHAFNYAGSESILTSLWKIDERSSAEIIELFYDYIKSGKPKDEALRLAKLDYIKNTDGRTVAPQYWAGLALMGDTSPIVISTGTNWLYWILGIGLLFIVGLFMKNRI